MRQRINHPASRGMAGLLTLLLLSACASTPRPEEVCSASWIKPRTDAALGQFQSQTRDTWDRLRRTGEGAAERGTIGLVEKATVLLSLTSLVNDFQSSQALKDLRTLGQTCDDPDLVKNALLGTLEEYNVPQPYLNLLNELDAFVELLGNASTR